ncbi:MAG: hypothetical protein AAF346_07700 [Pseudomonadota bacterium]
MQTSIYLAKLIGPVVAIAGLGFLLNRAAFIKFADDFISNTGFIMMSGFPALLAGLAVVNAHNVWVADWPVIITLLGWAAVVGGIMRITMPSVVRSIASVILGASSFIVVEAIILIGLGGWLTYAGYITS